MRMDVWIETCDRPVGHLARAEDKTLTFVYAKDAGKEQRLSLSLPIQPAPFKDADCRGYFANLLFEGPQLDKVFESYKLDRDDIGTLLWHLGGDCPGAISITPEGAGPGKTPGRFPNDYDVLQEARLHEVALSLHLHQRLPDPGRDPSPIAGVQGKIAVLAHNGQIFLPKPGSRAPTTHILKVSPASDPDITRHEVALLKIAETCGIATAPCQSMEFAAQGRRIHAILSTRFDRKVDIVDGKGLITRLHSEDFCQALGLSPFLKYERNSLNPQHRFCASAIAQIGAQASVPSLFQRDFSEHCFFNLLVGNSDNHGKNGSLLHQNGGTALAPLYDVVPVFMDRRVTHQLAFRHGQAEFAEDFTRDDLRDLLVELGFGKPQMARVAKQITALAKKIAVAALTLAPKDLADALHAQAMVVEAAIGLAFDLPQRDYFDRILRDDGGSVSGGWGGLS